eukprot:365474-Chlamydomonas_euryale.AAC.2
MGIRAEHDDNRGVPSLRPFVWGWHMIRHGHQGRAWRRLGIEVMPRHGGAGDGGKGKGGGGGGDRRSRSGQGTSTPKYKRNTACTNHKIQIGTENEQNTQRMDCMQNTKHAH